jgi:hypothetical protein
MTAQLVLKPTIADIEREVVHMAYVVEQYGERYAPILDSLIGHLDAAKRSESPLERARRILDRAEADGIVVPRRSKK